MDLQSISFASPCGVELYRFDCYRNSYLNVIIHAAWGVVVRAWRSSVYANSLVHTGRQSDNWDDLSNMFSPCNVENERGFTPAKIACAATKYPEKVSASFIRTRGGLSLHAA
ncbi:hypothetical protein SCP_1600020 [Sparassis crispa]|uniref:Uncharacterized protein n=1 Tax=Sparassis crispa TaxID=139825 RepID=A0A401H4L4_9APHY|nr:hypothetical protein SCP_1600020 [Sparassis crispa]GBE89341.1 hypothetical protein SCP_1600020 [Sparassis crispa]